MTFPLQPTLETDTTLLIPLDESDFEALYAVAADPKIWEQHPNRDRWKRPVFRTFFDGALQSKGAFKVVEKTTGKLIGSTRYYNYNATEKSVLIGYTFYATEYWGKGINGAVKSSMLQHAFQFVDRVYFHIGADNIRSQVAIGRLGAEKTDETDVAYFGEATKRNVVYRIEKQNWIP